jgi:hypothetical protein
MKRQVRIFVEGRQLDLFNDESIEVTSTIQNIQDISKTFTDFSQSFTIPTSANNNAIWQYFYENALNSSINYQERLEGYIEIDMTFFRRGKIQMEKSQLKNGQPNSYTITFYGDVTTLKDLVGEDLLSVLDHSTLDHDYSFTEIYNRITNPTIDWDVCYPLITSNRVWQYQGVDPSGNFPNWYSNTGANNISNNAGAIDYRELFPAVRVKSIFDLIAAQYGVTFTGSFLTDNRFKQAYLWYKNKNDFDFIGQAQNVTFNSVIAQGGSTYNLNPSSPPYVFDFTQNVLNVYYQNGASFMGITFSVASNSNPSVIYYLDTYVNGSLYQTTQGQGFTLNASITNIPNVQGLYDVYEFKLRASAAVSITLDITYSVSYFIGANFFTDFVTIDTNVNNLTTFSDLQTLAPTMKVQDFISGILKQFNLTCYGTKPNTFNIVPLADWYGAGAVIDITEFTDKDEIGIDRVKLYKKIGFKFQPSENFMNKKYFEVGLKEWGNTEYQYPYDGGEFTLEVPFENMLFNKFTGTNLQVGYSLDSSFSPNIPKPLLLYKYGGITLANHIHYTDGSGFFTNFNYTMFGQDLTNNGIKYSINFAPETSSYWLYPIQQSIFATYYFPYLANLFNPKNRLTTVKANLPVSILTGIQLNDRVVIRDKRYLINQMKTNLVTGVTEFELLNDFMPVNPVYILQPPPDKDVVVVPITLPNVTSKTGSVASVRFTSTNSDVVITPDEITEDRSVEITLPTLDTATRITEESDTRITEDGYTLETESRNDVIFIDIEYEYANGEILNGQIIIIR